MALAVALALPLALELGTDVQELAGAALGACLLQGVVHWMLRRRAARVRRQAINEVRSLLRDRINNHLQVVLFSLAESGAHSETLEDRERLGAALEAVAAVTRTLEELSTDSLRRWQDHYGSSIIDGASAFGIGAGSETNGAAAGR
jgi:hypothetical protein